MQLLQQNFTNPETATQVRRQDWSMSVGGFGEIAQGATDISQCILLSIANRKGTDPFRPLFGSDIWEHIDKPIQISAPDMVREIRTAIDLWEPRVRVTKVGYFFQSQGIDEDGTPSKIVFQIGWKLVGGDLTGQTDVLLGLEEAADDGTIPPSPILTLIATEMNDPLATENEELLLI